MLTETKIESCAERILVLAPLRQDAPAVAGLLTRAGLSADICADIKTLIAELDRGAGAVLIAEEALQRAEDASALQEALARQPAWSELTVLIISRRQNRQAHFAGDYPYVVLLERPLRSPIVLSALRAALLARRRQYQIRDHLFERARQAEELQRLASSLEDRVNERTRQLEEAMKSRAEAERAFRVAQKMEAVGQLTGGIAHDFNNLLMVFLGGLNLLDRKRDDEVHRQLVMDGMRQAAERAQALTKQLLTFARKMTLTPEPIDLRRMIESQRALLGGALRGDISLEFHLESDLQPIFADPAQLELALLNLAVNARDAMPRGGILKIAARNETFTAGHPSGLTGDFVTIEVKDTGGGILPELIDKVFDPFFTTKGVGHGTGLGLSQVYGFAKQSGGHATISSVVGQGTSVFLHLPRATSTASQAVAEKSGSSAQAGPPLLGCGKTVLLVEDHDQVANVADHMLQILGFKVVHAANAPEALKQIDQMPDIDLVFSDVIMPGGMNGFELASEVSRLRPEMPILLTSGYTNLGQNGFRPFKLLQKPYQLPALEKALRESLSAPATRDRKVIDGGADSPLADSAESPQIKRSKGYIAG